MLLLQFLLSKFYLANFGNLANNVDIEDLRKLANIEDLAKPAKLAKLAKNANLAKNEYLVNPSDNEYLVHLANLSNLSKDWLQSDWFVFSRLVFDYNSVVKASLLTFVGLAVQERALPI